MKSSVRLKFRQITIMLIMSCIIGVIGACSNKDNAGNAAPPSVIVVPAFMKNVTQSMDIVGQIVAKESVYLRARVKGFLEKRNFVEGSFVRKNDLLFQIEKAEYEADVQAAQAQLDTAKANLKNDTIDYQRQKYLADKKAVSMRIFEKAAAQKAISEASILSAGASLKEAKLNLSYTNINSPFSGRIGLAKYSVGNVVGPESDPLAHVVMVDPIQVEFNLTESFITTLLQEIYHGEKDPDPKSKKKFSPKDVVIRLILSNGTKYAESGSIDFLNNIINSMTGTIKMRALFKNPKAILVPGAYVTVILQRSEKINSLLIPQAAIQDDQAGKFVMVVNEKNEVVKHYIKVGTIYGTDIVVTSGLKKGDRVIKEGLQKVREGLIVNPTTEKVETQKNKNGEKHDPSAPVEGKIASEQKKQKPEISDKESKKSTDTTVDSNQKTTSDEAKKTPESPQENKMQKKNTNQG